MKIAALIQVHQNPRQLSRLLDRLSGSLWATFVHVDRKTAGSAFAGLHAKATFLTERVKVHWGGLSQVEAALLLLREAYRDRDVTHFYHMSGQCYPVKSDAQIAAAIGGMPAGSANLISLIAMPVSHKPLYRFTRHAFFDVGSPLLRKVLNRLAAYLPDRSLEELRGIELYGGTSWWLLERATVGKLLDFIDRNPWYVQAFRHSTSADEMLIHSLVKSLGITVGAGCPTAAKWIEGRANPEIVTAADHRRFVDGPAFFARKYADFHPTE